MNTARGEQRPALGTYVDRLRDSYERAGTLLCFGIDPVVDYIPEVFTGSIRERIVAYITEILEIISSMRLIPSAFKTNIGFFHCLDRPRDGEFEGSLALADILNLLTRHFQDIPHILDAKRADIAKSSVNYAREAFYSWQANALTAPPYMGNDSVQPLLAAANQVNGLVYVLVRTSNPGSENFQSLRLWDGRLIADDVAKKVCEWHLSSGCCGAVIGAPFILQSEQMLGLLAECRVPLLIPGVGAQGGSVEEVMSALGVVNYPLTLARINVSSGITHPWSARATDTWKHEIVKSINLYHKAFQ